MDLKKSRNLLSKSEFKQIKKSRTRVDGKKVVTDDVNKLKSLKVTPDIPSREKIHYYREPIWIEYYIPKESRFAYEIKFLFVKLVDVVPRKGGIDEILEQAIENNEIIDPIRIMEKFPKYKDEIRNSYRNFMLLLEKISLNQEQYLESDDPEFLKSSIYATETLMKYEPTLASLEFLGEFVMYNLIWFIRKLNEHKKQFSLEDETIALLIQIRNKFWEENNLPEDPDFELFSALFYEQAFPHRGAEALSAEDFLLD